MFFMCQSWVIAYKSYMTARAMDPSDLEADIQKHGQALYRQKDFEGALRCFNKVWRNPFCYLFLLTS